MKYLPILSLTALSASSVCAQNFEPAPYSLTDGFAIIPQVEANIRYDDNIYYEESNATSSSIYLLKPSFKFGTDDGINQYGGLYQLTSAIYSNGSEDNYIDHSLSLLAHTEYSDKHRTDFKLSFDNIHEDRGSAFTESDSTAYDEPLKYNQLAGRAYYQFGGLTSMMRLGGGLAYADKTYQNFTDDTQYSDSTGLRFFADVDYQLASVTFFTVDLYTTAVNYDHVASGSETKDNRDSRLLLGLRWEGLGKTTGTMKAGYQYKTFDSDSRDTFSGVNVDLGIVWQPVQYSSFTVHVNHSAEDSDNVGDYLESFASSLEWQHDWTDSFGSIATLIYSNDQYIGTTREDDTKSASLYLNYNLTRWLQLKAGYEYTTKDSNATDVSYDKNALNLGFVVAL